MIFKIQLALPHRQAAVAVHPGAKLVKIGAGKGLAHTRYARNALFQPVGGFQHGPRGAAAAVAITVGNQDIVVDILVLITAPRANKRIGMQLAVVGGKVILLVLAGIQGGD